MDSWVLFKSLQLRTAIRDQELRVHKVVLFQIAVISINFCYLK
jgi:hypothetical protein